MAGDSVEEAQGHSENFISVLTLFSEKRKTCQNLNNFFTVALIFFRRILLTYWTKNKQFEAIKWQNPNL